MFVYLELADSWALRDGIMMFYFLLLISSIFIQYTGCDISPQLDIILNSIPKNKGSPQNTILLKRVEDTLNLTCKISSSLVQDVLPKYDMIWRMPVTPQNSEHRVTRTHDHNVISLVVHNLQESDSGNYTCEAFRDDDDSAISKSVRINVKSKKLFCGDTMFQCPQGICINRRFMCDGKPDCRNGADEAENYCGQHPCGNKLVCPDGRCIPIFWCCDQYLDPNCTVKEKLPCCQLYSKPYPDVDQVYQSDQRYSDMGFLQTTIYAVVGSAMAFMFVVTVLIVAICRIHLKRHSNMARCQGGGGGGGRVVTSTRNHLQQLPLYDVDLCLNRHPTDILVTYNINNGVQFVGRPVSPPPYCEVVSTPPREGPPPAYISHENLPRATSQSENHEEEEAVPLTSNENQQQQQQQQQT